MPKVSIQSRFTLDFDDKKSWAIAEVALKCWTDTATVLLSGFKAQKVAERERRRRNSSV